MAKQQVGNSDLKNFQKNVKSTALGIKFAKTLYTNPTSLSPQQITSICKVLGLNLSKDQEMTAATAQMLISGKTAVQSYQAGEGASKAGQGSANATAVAVKTITYYGNQNGWFDDDSASLISIGTDVCLIVASAGTNVAAWVSLCLDLANAVSSKENIAAAFAAQDLQNKFSRIIQPQNQIAADSFKDLQEGRIGIFGLITRIAYEAPYMFPQYISQNSALKDMFPEISLIPIVRTRIEGRGTSEVWGSWPWGGRYVLARYEEEKHIDVNKIGVDFTSRDDAAGFIYNTLIMPWTAAYYYANNEIVARGNAPIDTVALLSMIGNPQAEISDTFNYANLLLGLNITPKDLGERTLLRKISDRYVDYVYKDMDQSYRETGISTGYENPNIRVIQSTKENVRSYISNLEKNNNIREMMSFKPFYEAVREYFSFEKTTFEKDPTLGGTLNAKFSSDQTRAWRKISNYISVLHLVDQFRTDPYLKNTIFAKSIPTFLPSVPEFEQRYRDLQLLCVQRNSEILSNGIVAGFLGTSSQKLVLKGYAPDGAKIYGVK